MASFTFDFNASDTVAQALQSLTTAVDSELDELNKTLDTQLADWQGAGADQYRNAQAQWNAGAAEMAQALGTAQQTLSQIHVNYADAEQNITRLWDSVQTS
jgi:WXG100 family type VII secretion target